MGEYYLKIYFTGPPSSNEVYEILDYVCHFKVDMSNIKRIWEFEKNACTYIEDYKWDFNKIK